MTFSDPSIAFIVSRAVHFAACLVLLGTFAFDRLVVSALAGELRRRADPLWGRIARILVLSCIPLALVSGAGWLALAAIGMSGLPWKQALQPDDLRLVWGQTHFGVVWQWRTLFWLVTSIAGGVLATWRRHSVPRSVCAWTGLTASIVLCGSLAWAGHGITGGVPTLHLPADAVHLVISGFWPAGLLPFAWMLLRLRTLPASPRRHCIARLTARFSAMSLAGVVLLTATGLINTWALLGPPANLVRTPYGKTLLIKIVLFAVMAAFGAANRLRLRPRLGAVSDANDGTAADPPASRAAAWLRFNVVFELLLGAIVIVIVALLGLLPAGME